MRKHGGLKEILATRRAPGAIIRGPKEAFKSHVDGSIISTERDLREHNARNEVVDCREYGEGNYCDPEAKRRREEYFTGESQAHKREVRKALEEANQKVLHGYKPHTEEINDDGSVPT